MQERKKTKKPAILYPLSRLDGDNNIIMNVGWSENKEFADSHNLKIKEEAEKRIKNEEIFILKFMFFLAIIFSLFFSCLRILAK